MPRLLALIVLLIVYGSLFPWRFQASRIGIGQVVEYLFHGGGYLSFRDLLVNVLFYMPVGACGFLAFRNRLRPIGAAVAAVLLGAVLSASIEIAQTFESSRRTSAYDVYANTAGSIAGAAVAMVFSTLSSRLNRRPALRPADAGALALLVCCLAYLLFPFIPATADAITAKLSNLQLQPASPIAFVSAAGAWFVIGSAMSAAGVRVPRTLCALSVCLVPGQLLIFSRQPLVEEFAGAVVGAAVFAYTFHHPARHRAAAVTMLCVVAAQGLAPFDFGASAKTFSWLPFAALLQTEWYRASQVLAGKLFFYAATIWSLRNIPMRLSRAAVVTAALLLAIEVAQIWLTRTPDITDPVLALMIGVGFDALRREPKRTSSPSGTSA